MAKFFKTIKEDKKGNFDLPKALGVNQERADEIISAIKHAKIDAHSFQELLDISAENIGEMTPQEAFLFGRAFTMLSGGGSFLEHLLSHGHHNH